VQRVTRNVDQRTMRIVVKPDYLWPTGYGYVVGLKGLEMRVSQTENAIQLTQEQGAEGNGDYEHVKPYVFLPEPSHSSFAFTVEGVDLVLVSLSCRMMSPPPSPPLLSPPPPEPPEIVTVPVSNGLRSFSSRVAVWLLVVSACFIIYTRYCKSHAVVSHADGAYAGQPRGNGLPGAPDDEGSWSVLMDVSGQEFDIPLPRSIASDAEELKQALAELANEVLGETAVPSSWMRDDFRTMIVQYTDSKGRQAKVHDEVNMSAVYASRSLQVSQATSKDLIARHALDDL